MGVLQQHNRHIHNKKLLYFQCMKNDLQKYIYYKLSSYKLFPPSFSDFFKVYNCPFADTFLVELGLF